MDCDLSQRNKDTIWRFQEHLATTGISKPRILKYFEKLRRIGTWLEKDFDQATKQDMERVFAYIHQREDLRPITKVDYNIVVKRFYKWLLGKDEEFPEQVKWLKTTVKSKDKTVLSQADLITEKEAQALINASEHPRDRAFVSLLYETGCRIGELANLKIGNVLFDEYGCVLNVNGKTGPRRVRVVNGASHLTAWLDIHPFRNDRERPLWVLLKNAPDRTQWKYTSIRNMLSDLFLKAGVNKRCNPHIFRHSRATFMANFMTEAQMKAYFGWVQHSDMASTYVHLSGRDTDNAILEINGLAKKEDKQSGMQPRKCPRCQFLNNSQGKYCSRCSAPLDAETAVQLQNELLNKDLQHQNVGGLMSHLLKDQEFKTLMLKKILEMKLERSLEML